MLSILGFESSWHLLHVSSEYLCTYVVWRVYARSTKALQIDLFLAKEEKEIGETDAVWAVLVLDVEELDFC